MSELCGRESLNSNSESVLSDGAAFCGGGGVGVIRPSLCEQLTCPATCPHTKNRSFSLTHTTIVHLSSRFPGRLSSSLFVCTFTPSLPPSATCFITNSSPVKINVLLTVMSHEAGTADWLFVKHFHLSSYTFKRHKHLRNE